MLFDTEPEGLEGINAFYDAEILPNLGELEASRKKGELIGIVVSILLGIPLVGGSVWLTFFTDGVQVDNAFVPYLICAMLIAIGGFGIYKLAFLLRGRTKRRHKEFLLAGFAKFRGFQYDPMGDANMVMDMVHKSLLPSFTKMECEDGLRGTIGDLDFQFAEATLYEKTETYDSEGKKEEKTERVFKGFLVSIDVTKEFDCRVTILREMGAFSFVQSLTVGMKRMKLEDPRFEKLYDAFSDDQVQGRYIMTPTMMDRLVTLSEQYPHMMIAFHDKQIHITCDRQNLFEAGSASDNLTSPEPARKLMQDMALFERLIDALALDSKSRL